VPNPTQSGPSPARAARADPRVLLGLLGYPIAHSAAPAMHEAAGDATGLRTLYHLLEIPALDAAGLHRVLDSARELGFAGLNVTFPYKEAVLPLLDELSPGARAVAAVNTVVIADGKLAGHNTDATGFAAALRAELGATIAGPVALIGTGGMGRAAAFAMAGLGLSLRLFDADSAKAARLAADLAPLTPVSIAPTLPALLDGAVGLVNATPIGMLPDRGSPVPAALLHGGLWVADAVYYPLITPLLAAAQAVGARTITGRSLSLHQCYDAFRLFTGRDAPHDVVARAFDAVIAARAN